MHLDEYQLKAARTNSALHRYEGALAQSARTASDPRDMAVQDDALAFTALMLASEAGEVASLVQKHIWQGHALDRNALREELGDALWALSQVAKAAGLTLDEVADHNIIKLVRRYPDGFAPERSIAR